MCLQFLVTHRLHGGLNGIPGRRLERALVGTRAEIPQPHEWADGDVERSVGLVRQLLGEGDHVQCVLGDGKPLAAGSAVES